jgi:hypothetical protein
MIRHTRLIGFALGALIALAAIVGGVTGARAEKLPIPQGMCTANQLLYAESINEASCTSAPSIGTSITVGSGTAITKIAVLTAAIVNFQLAANTCVVKEYTVTGLTTGDKVIVNPTYLAKEAILANAWVSAANTLEITFCNPHAVAVDPEAGTVNVTAIRS